MLSDTFISTDYWTELQITPHDVEFLHNYLFEYETPLTARELVAVLVDERIRNERIVLRRKRQAGGRTYIPGDSYQVGDGLVFPLLNWQPGSGGSIRAGRKPQLGGFFVFIFQMDNWCLW